MSEALITLVVTTLNGQSINISSKADWITFVKCLLADRYIITEAGFIPLHAIATIMRTDITLPQAALSFTPTQGSA